jgi:hypothetical protein
MRMIQRDIDKETVTESERDEREIERQKGKKDMETEKVWGRRKRKRDR